MSLHRNSFIGASHSARLQRKFNIVNLFYVTAAFIFISKISRGFLGEESSWLLGFIAAGIILYYMGTILFFVVANIANAVVLVLMTISAINKPIFGVHPFIQIIVGIGLWLFMFSLLWFSNNYYTYLKGYTEKELDSLYKN